MYYLGENEHINLGVVPYSGYNLRGTISANHQISHLEVIFAIIKFANHGMVCMARSIYVPSAYRYFNYKHRSEVDLFTIESVIRAVIRGFHIYEEVWSSVIGEVLVCRDILNHHDFFAVATYM